jgi:peptide/nickel transport system substrate-binding protein
LTPKTRIFALKKFFSTAAVLLVFASSAHAQDHRGGTLKIVSASAGGTIDPQLNYTLEYAEVFANTYDGLVTFRKTGGPSSIDIVPDLATSIPAPQDGGKTYVFTLQKNIKFSNGKTVTPDDVVASFERLFKVSNPVTTSWYSVIVGADACLATPATCTLPNGVIADDAANTVTFHLTKPDPEFFDQLAVPFGTIVPAGTPAKDMGTIPIPGTGAYMITSYDPQKMLVEKRNPYFHQWSVDAQPTGYVDEIDYEFNVSDENAITAIENGQLDWEFDPSPTDRLAEMATRFASEFHIDPLFEVFYAPMNVNIPPFNNLDARLAVNFAINRRSAVKIYGGSNLATPSCQILPPGFPGYQPYCPYTENPGTVWSKPDLAKAQALMAASGQIGAAVTIIDDDQGVDPQLGTYLASVLNQLGFKATVRTLSQNIQFNYIQNTNNKVQISVTQWFDDYPAASDFLNVLLSCGAFHPGTDNSVNIAGYCNKKYDADVQAALNTAITDPTAANTQWAAVDKQATDAAPWVSLFAPKHVDFVSKRLGNFSYSLQYNGPLFATVWVQ